MKFLRFILASLLLLGAGTALAHAELETATPAQNSVLETLPTEITLNFSEEVEVRFSLFKVYKLDETAVTEEPVETAEPETGGAADDEDYADKEHSDEEEHAESEGHDHENAESAPSSPEQLRLNGLAGALVSRVLETRGDEDARADAGIATTDATSKTVTLKLNPDLTAGTYVVMWRALSADTHSEQGYYVFTYRPTP